jgi:hypothetical protein
MKYMKTIRWLTFGVLAFACAAEWLVASVVGHSVQDMFLRRGLLIPRISSIFILNPSWVLCIPMPWFVYLLCNRKCDCSTEKALLFALSVAAVLVALSTILVLGAIMPWLPTIYSVATN